MNDHLQELAGWVAPLLQRLDPAPRKNLMRALAQHMQRSQMLRIAAQRNPDGTPYAPRRPREQLQKRQGAIRSQAMFMNLRKARNLPRRAAADYASVAINPRVAYVARVHHYGLRDKVDRRNPRSPEVRYPRRELLGINAQDMQAIEDILLQHISTT